MRASSDQNEVRHTLIQKVVVLGTNPALMAGYINQVSGSTIAYHLYSSLGVGIGVARTRAMSGHEIVLQLWLIPNEEKVPGINKSFSRGHTGAIIVVRGQDINQLDTIISTISPEAYHSLLVVVVGTQEEAEEALNIISNATCSVPRVDFHVNPREALSNLGDALVSRRMDKIAVPMIVCMDEDECPEYHHVHGRESIPECTMAEIDYIQEIAQKIGAHATPVTAEIKKPEGTFQVNIRTGTVILAPVICQLCVNDCKRDSNICIIKSDSGWSSEGLGERALLVLAKIWGIYSGELPNHVKKQVRYTIQCNHFIPREDLDIEEIETAMEALGYQKSQRRRTLLEEASARVSDQRISKTVYDMLKSRLDHVLSQRAQEGN
ncbi:MAG: hypothetical protein KAR33_09295 [Candidatus Thorarchaeota archaeon]|nr:hypothetical protein [Candidatus Thorarchaeota archaeon]